MNVISKISTTPTTAAQKANDPTSPVLSPPNNRHQSTGVPSSLTTSVLSVSGTMDTSIMGLSEGQLKKQGLDCLIAVLRSLVAWGTAAGKADDTVHTPKSQTGEEIRRDPVTPEASYDKLSVAGMSTETLRQPTPDLVDDPGKFESAKQKKTTLLEGIKKFNFKPKRVCFFVFQDKIILSCF
jgi:brefeldin A-inhibited guanine nucleotide-exchange protein